MVSAHLPSTYHRIFPRYVSDVFANNKNVFQFQGHRGQNLHLLWVERVVIEILTANFIFLNMAVSLIEQKFFHLLVFMIHGVLDMLSPHTTDNPVIIVISCVREKNGRAL